MSVLRYRTLVGRAKDSVERFLSSLDSDKALAKYAGEVLLAHVKALAACGLIPPHHRDALLGPLRAVVQSDGEEVYRWIESRGLIFEDFFEALEAYLHEVAEASAGYVALGRSRNDHVAAALRLLARDRVMTLLFKLLELREALLEKAMEYRGLLFPYFTHQQVAQCGSAAIYFLSYEHSIAVLWRTLFEALELLEENPLGSGAAAGTLSSLDRQTLSKTLCLSQAILPPYYATGSRLFLLYPMSIMALLLAELSRFAEDMIFLHALMHEGLRPPVEHVSTSSIMPHKRNLVTMELARAKASKVIGALTAAMSIYKALPYGYNLDLQEINGLFVETSKEAIDVVTIMADFVRGLGFDEEAIKKYINGKPCWSAELVEHIALVEGRPAREAYFYVGRLLKEAGMSNTEKGGLLGRFDVWRLVREKPIEGYVKVLIEGAWKLLEEDKFRAKTKADGIQRCTAELIS